VCEIQVRLNSGFLNSGWSPLVSQSVSLSAS